LLDKVDEDTLMSDSAAGGYPDFHVRRRKSDERGVKQVLGGNKNTFLGKGKKWLCQQENAKKGLWLSKG
jgi:hypothetical protein